MPKSKNAEVRKFSNGMSDSRPIGIFDSGLGGLTVVSRMEEILPNEDIIYFGDTARVPYGTKSSQTITKFSVENVEFLMRYNVKLILVACNTASSLALNFLKRCFKVPIIGVIAPGARAAAKATRNHRIGVIGTRATISSGAYEKAVRKTSQKNLVFTQSCPMFVPLVEEGWIDKDVTGDIVRIYLEPLKAKRVDTLILGCTHYPLLKNAIRKFMGSSVLLVDSAKEVAKEARAALSVNAMLNKSHRKGAHRFFVSDEPAPFIKIGEKFLKRRINCVKQIA